MQEDKIKKIEKLTEKYTEMIRMNDIELKNLLINFAKEYREVWDR